MRVDTIIFFSSLCLGIVCSIFALLLIVAILTSRRMRSTLRYVTVASLMAGELLVGWIYCPALLSVLIGSMYPLSCGVSVALHFLFIALSVGSWGLVLQHIYYLVSLAGVKPRGLSAFAACLLRVVACALPWILAVIITLVLSFTVFAEYSRDGCRVVNLSNRRDHLLYMVVNEFVPRSLAVILTVASIVAHTFSRRRSTTASIALLAPSPHPIEFPIALNLATLVSLLLLLVPGALYLASVYSFSGTATVLKSAVMPFVWMSDRNIRRRMAATLCCRCRLDEDDKGEAEDESAMSYRSLEEKDLGLKTEKN